MCTLISVVKCVTVEYHFLNRPGRRFANDYFEFINKFLIK